MSIGSKATRGHWTSKDGNNNPPLKVSSIFAAFYSFKRKDPLSVWSKPIQQTLFQRSFLFNPIPHSRKRFDLQLSFSNFSLRLSIHQSLLKDPSFRKSFSILSSSQIQLPNHHDFSRGFYKSSKVFGILLEDLDLDILTFNWEELKKLLASSNLCEILAKSTSTSSMMPSRAGKTGSVVEYQNSRHYRRGLSLKQTWEQVPRKVKGSEKERYQRARHQRISKLKSSLLEEDNAFHCSRFPYLLLFEPKSNPENLSPLS